MPWSVTIAKIKIGGLLGRHKGTESIGSAIFFVGLGYQSGEMVYLYGFSLLAGYYIS